MSEAPTNLPMASRFRGFLPVVVDVETGGFIARTDALLEMAAVLLGVDEDGRWHRIETHACHVQPFPGAKPIWSHRRWSSTVSIRIIPCASRCRNAKPWGKYSIPFERP